MAVEPSPLIDLAGAEERRGYDLRIHECSRLDKAPLPWISAVMLQPYGSGGGGGRARREERQLAVVDGGEQGDGMG